MDKFKKIYKKNSNFVLREIGDQKLLIPIISEEEEDIIYDINKVGLIIWDLIDGKRTVKEIINLISKKFKIKNKRSEKDVVSFIKKLKTIKCILLIK